MDLVYMGSATEKGLELMVKALTPYPGGAGGPCGRRPADAGDGQRSDALGNTSSRIRAAVRRTGGCCPPMPSIR